MPGHTPREKAKKRTGHKPVKVTRTTVRRTAKRR